VTDRREVTGARYRILTARRATTAMKKARWKVHNSVSQLPASLQSRVEQMLVEGATFEETVADLMKQGTHLTVQAVSRFFFGSVALQRERIRRQMEAAEKLRQSLHSDRLHDQAVLLKQRRDSVEERIAEARVKVELGKWELTKRRLRDLRPALRRVGNCQSLGPEAAGKIEAIYGLFEKQ